MARPPWRKTSSPNCLQQQKTHSHSSQVRSAQARNVRGVPLHCEESQLPMPRKFTLRVDNQALSWLKTYSTDQDLIGRWIMALEKYHFRVEHPLPTAYLNEPMTIGGENNSSKNCPRSQSVGTSSPKVNTSVYPLRHGLTCRDGFFLTIPSYHST